MKLYQAFVCLKCEIQPGIPVEEHNILGNVITVGSTNLDHACSRVLIAGNIASNNTLNEADLQEVKSHGELQGYQLVQPKSGNLEESRVLVLVASTGRVNIKTFSGCEKSAKSHCIAHGEFKDAALSRSAYNIVHNLILLYPEEVLYVQCRENQMHVVFLDNNQLKLMLLCDFKAYRALIATKTQQAAENAKKQNIEVKDV